MQSLFIHSYRNFNYSLCRNHESYFNRLHSIFIIDDGCYRISVIFITNIWHFIEILQQSVKYRKHYLFIEVYLTKCVKMKKILLAILIVLCSLAVYSNDNEEIKTEDVTHEVVINNKMIENFNALEFENTNTCLDLFKSYSIDDAKLIYTAYQQGEFVLNNKEEIEVKLAELKSETENSNTYVKHIPLYSNK